MKSVKSKIQTKIQTHKWLFIAGAIVVAVLIFQAPRIAYSLPWN